MANLQVQLAILLSILVILSTFVPRQTESYYLRKKHVKVLKKVAVAATVLGNRKKLMIPLPVPLPLPIPIIHKHEPIIAPIDPISHIKAFKGYGLAALGGGAGLGGSYGYGQGYGRRR